MSILAARSTPPAPADRLDFGGDRAAWLAWRAGGIGASEAAAALGVSPYETPWALYQKKVGAAPEAAVSEAMEIGSLLEPALAELYRRRTGRAVVASQVCLASRRRPFLRATLDGVADDGRVVELKAVGARMAGEWGEPGSDAAPAHYLCQVQQQLIVSGADVADVAVLIGGQEFRVLTVARDDEFAALALPALERFWRAVERREPPEPRPADAALVARLAPEHPAESVELGEAAAALADLYAELGAQARDLERRRDEARASLILAMNGCGSATLPDGRRVARKEVVRRGHVVKESRYFSLTIGKKASE